MALRAAEQHYTEQARLATLVARRVRGLWGRVLPEDVNTWQSLLREAAAAAAAGQYRAAANAERYVAVALAEQAVEVVPEATVRAAGFVGYANDGRPLATLLDLPRISTLTAIAQGMEAAQAVKLGGRQAEMLAVSTVQDAGRQADSVAIFSRPNVGWVRMVNPPCCDRCAVLAGKFFRGNEGFQRHPRCSCQHVPSVGDTSVGPQRADLLATSTGGGLKGMSTTDTPKGHPTPDSIYRMGSDRDETLTLLERWGFAA